MANKKVILIFAFVVLISALRCDYTPTETNFKNISIPENNIDIKVLDPSYINQMRGDVTFAIQADLKGHTIKGILGFIDETEVHLQLTDPSHILFKTGSYPDGEYTFSLYLFTSTGSGSLADRIADEVFYVKKEYPVTLFNDPVYTPEIKGFTIVDGALSINWQKYDQLCFKNYILKKNGSVIATITDTNQTSYLEKTYIGEGAEYELTTTVINYSFKKTAVRHPGTSPKFVSTTKTDDDKLILKWNKFPFTTAFGKYVLTGFEEAVEVTAIDDTTIVDESPPLGIGEVYTLKVYSKTGKAAAGEGSIQGPSIGKAFELNHRDLFKYIPEKNIFVRIFYQESSYSYQIAYFGGDDLNLLGSQNLTFQIPGYARTVSDDGRYIYIANGAEVYRLNSNSLLLEETTDLTSLMPEGQYHPISPIYDIKVSGNNFLAAIIRYENKRMRLAIFDMENKKWITSYQYTFREYEPELNFSNNGDFLFIANRIYEFVDSNIRYIGTLENCLITFSHDYSSLIVTDLAYNTIRIVNCSDLQTIKTLSGNYFGAPSVDRKTGLVGVGGKIIDIENERERGSIRLKGLVQSYQNGFYFSGGYYKHVTLN